MSERCERCIENGGCESPRQCWSCGGGEEGRGEGKGKGEGEGKGGGGEGGGGECGECGECLYSIRREEEMCGGEVKGGCEKECDVCKKEEQCFLQMTGLMGKRHLFRGVFRKETKKIVGAWFGVGGEEGKGERGVREEGKGEEGKGERREGGGRGEGGRRENGVFELVVEGGELVGFFCFGDDPLITYRLYFFFFFFLLL